jgi:hypothetical protein
MSQTQEMKDRPIHLDDLLTVPEFARWRKIAVQTARRQIAAGCPGVIMESREDVRIHPRTYLEKRLKIKTS